LSLFSGAPPTSTAGALGAALAALGIALGGLDLALALVGLLGLAVAAEPWGLGWVHHLPGVRFILPLYGMPLVVLPFTQAIGRGIDALPRLRLPHVVLGAVAPPVAWLVLWLFCHLDLSLALPLLRR